MFEIGEYIIYGNTGVCKVGEVTKMKAPGTKDDKLYELVKYIHMNHTFFWIIEFRMTLSSICY